MRVPLLLLLLAPPTAAPLEWWPAGRPVPLPDEPPAGYPRALALPDGQLLLIAGDDRVYRLPANLTSAVRLGRIPVRQGGRAVPFWSPHGRLMAVANDNLERPRDGEAADHSVRLFAGDNDGAAWAPVSTVVETGERGCYEPFPLVTRSGDLLVAYSREYPHANPAYQVCELRRSGDDGLTWSEPITIAAHDSSRDGMPVLCELGNGRLLAVFETTDAGYFRIAAATSDDGGQTWHGRAVVDDPGPGGYSGAPFVIPLDDGRLVVTYQTRRWSPDEDIAWRESRDGAATWSPARPLFAGDGKQLWAALARLDGRRLLALTSSPGSDGRYGVELAVSAY